MIAHRPFRPILIARLHRLEDQAVRVICGMSGFVLARRERRSPLLVQPVSQSRVDGREDWIAGHQRQFVVEVDVGLLETPDVADRFAIGLQSFP